MNYEQRSAKGGSSMTFRDFQFSATHSITGRSEAAAKPHTHNYVVRFWFDGHPDQDDLNDALLRHYCDMDGSTLNKRFGNQSTDERLAAWFLDSCPVINCVGVRVTTDAQRGAEAWR